ncbi:MAG: hypothetical protein OEY43_03710, partial [Gammaproteobacteria bacterium]|nr:hypothetical protein [Gammaproteobacteria bacterium]
MSIIKNKNGLVGLIPLLLLQACSGGGGDSVTASASTVSVHPRAAIQCVVGATSGPVNNLDCADSNNVSVSGVISYDRVPHNPDGSLDYTAAFVSMPVRGATVDAVYPGGVQSAATDVNGNYQICVPKDTNGMIIRAYAEMKATGQPGWDFTVVDNTQGQALYSIQTAPFNVLASNITAKNRHAQTVWGGSSYTKHEAAPFAILDSIYDAYRTVLNECKGAQFPALKINWSENNVDVSGSPVDGNITTTAFDGEQIYVLGKEDADTDEYDGHVIIHEWAHYFEHNFSRLDSIGGSHSGGDILDIRVAFSEGFSNAYSAISTGDVNYYDSGGGNQSQGFFFNLEDNNCTNSG